MYREGSHTSYSDTASSKHLWATNQHHTTSSRLDQKESVRPGEGSASSIRLLPSFLPFPQPLRWSLSISSWHLRTRSACGLYYHVGQPSDNNNVRQVCLSGRVARPCSTRGGKRQVNVNVNTAVSKVSRRQLLLLSGLGETSSASSTSATNVHARSSLGVLSLRSLLLGNEAVLRLLLMLLHLLELELLLLRLLLELRLELLME